MYVLLYLALEDTGPRRLVEACGFQNVCRIDPVVVTPTHDMFLEVGSKLEFPHRYLGTHMLAIVFQTLIAAHLRHYT